jgi:hypothetical protein
MWGEDSVQPDRRPAQTLADQVRILVDVARGRAELPCVRQADDKSTGCMRSVHQIDDRRSSGEDSAVSITLSSITEFTLETEPDRR